MTLLQQLKGSLSEATATITQDTLRLTWQQLMCVELQTPKVKVYEYTVICC